MFERYTERARRAVFFARHAASVEGTKAIEMHHLLLGIMNAAPEFMAGLFAESDSEMKVRDELARRFPPQRPTSTSIDMPLSKDSRNALTSAADQAEKFVHRYIDVGHLLLGVLLQENSDAAAVLNAHGITFDKVRPIAGARVLEPRAELHKLIDQLPDDRLAVAAGYLRGLVGG
jgi:ATP-dependent Clp protease ATP-binding subunit ClpC